MIKLIRNFLLWISIAHGFLDLLFLDFDAYKISLYLMTMNVFYLLYSTYRTLSVSLFFIMVMYHLSQDFLYIEDSKYMLLSGPLIISAVFGGKINFVINMLNKIEISQENALNILTFFNITLGITFIVIFQSLFKLESPFSFYVGLLSSAFTYIIILENNSPINCIIIFLAMFHSPLTIYRSYQIYKINLIYSAPFCMVCSLICLEMFYRFSNKHVIGAAGIIFSLLQTHILFHYYINHLVFYFQSIASVDCSGNSH